MLLSEAVKGLFILNRRGHAALIHLASYSPLNSFATTVEFIRNRVLRLLVKDSHFNEVNAALGTDLAPQLRVKPFADSSKLVVIFEAEILSQAHRDVLTLQECENSLALALFLLLVLPLSLLLLFAPHFLPLNFIFDFLE